MKKIVVVLCLVFFSSAFAAVQEMKIGENILFVEIAKTEEEHRRGLSFRTHLGSDRGMLFVFEKPEILSFWMKNTYIPISIGFFDAKCGLIEILNMHLVSDRQKLRSYISSKPAKYALEVNQGWFRKHSIKKGDVFELSTVDSSKNMKKH